VLPKSTARINAKTVATETTHTDDDLLTPNLPSTPRMAANLLLQSACTKHIYAYKKTCIMPKNTTEKLKIMHFSRKNELVETFKTIWGDLSCSGVFFYELLVVKVITKLKVRGKKVFLISDKYKVR
jgi:hypothetical protein